MGAIGRLIQRQQKAKVTLKRKATTTAKTKNRKKPWASILQKPRNSKFQNNNNNSDITMGNQVSMQEEDNTRSTSSSKDLFNISSAVATRIKLQVEEILDTSDGGVCSVVTMAQDLQMDDKILSMYTEEVKFRDIILSLVGTTFGMMQKQQMDDVKGRYGWTGAMNRLEKFPSSRDTKVSSWEEAKVSLQQVLRFVDEEEGMEIDGGAPAAAAATSPDAIAAKFRKKMDKEMDQVQDNLHDLKVKGGTKWQKVESYADVNLDPEEAAQQALRDLRFKAKLKDAEDLDQAFATCDEVKALEERKRLAEAEERARSLMRPFTAEEQERIREAMFGYGPDDEIIAQDGNGADNVLRRSMQTLQPGQWLNDEVIHYFYLMLAKRDAELCKMDPSRKRSHFFKSFFMTKLLNEGNATRDGEYEYKNVKRWSKKVPGKDIFALDKIIFPINMGQMHWICAAIFMEKKKIQVFDSMGSSGELYLQALFQYLQDEHLDKKKTPLPDQDEWELITTTRDTPRQRNGFDCGVFTCMVADFISKDTPLVFSQEHINQCRERICLSILNGQAIM